MEEKSSRCRIRNVLLNLCCRNSSDHSSLAVVEEEKPEFDDSASELPIVEQSYTASDLSFSCSTSSEFQPLLCATQQALHQPVSVKFYIYEDGRKEEDVGAENLNHPLRKVRGYSVLRDTGKYTGTAHDHVGRQRQYAAHVDYMEPINHLDSDIDASLQQPLTIPESTNLKPTVHKRCNTGISPQTFVINNGPMLRRPVRVTQRQNEPPWHGSNVALRDLEEASRAAEGVFESVCIIDLRLPNLPVTAASRDLLPDEDLQPGESLFVDDNLDGLDFGIHRAWHDSGWRYYLVVKGHLLDRDNLEFTHRFLAQVDITRLIGPADVMLMFREDPWLAVAREEMMLMKTNHFSIGRRLPNAALPPEPVRILPPQVERIRLLYDYSFILRPSSRAVPDYDITHVTATLSHFFPQHVKSLTQALAFYAAEVMSLLHAEQKCFFDFRLSTNHAQRIVCALPMHRPDFDCYICFFVGNPGDQLW